MIIIKIRLLKKIIMNILKQLQVEQVSKMKKKKIIILSKNLKEIIVVQLYLRI